jgi:hypothetical protein
MKRLILFLLILNTFTINGNAQEASVEKSLWGIQVGLHPLSIYNESRLIDNIALRCELGFGFGWLSTQWAILPVMVIEPRYYYNLKRRMGKDKRTDGNSGNFLSLYTGVEPGIGISSKDVDLFPSVIILPMYGLRRNIGKHFNFETAFGVGYSWTFENHKLANGKKKRNTEGGTTYGIRIALGYKF